MFQQIALGLYEQQEFLQGMQKVSFKVEIKSTCLSIIARRSSVCLLMLQTTSLQIIFTSLHFAKSNLQSTFTNEKNCKLSCFTNMNKFISNAFRTLLFKSRLVFSVSNVAQNKLWCLNLGVDVTERGYANFFYLFFRGGARVGV